MRERGDQLQPTVALVAAALLVGACQCGAPDGVVDQCDETIQLPPSVSTDILFVIDNSISMREEQAKVVAELNTFVSTLANAPVQNDFQVGVISTGVTLNVRNCDPSSEPRLIEYEDESGRLQLGKDLQGRLVAESNTKILAFDDPDLLEQFALLVGQGIVGSGQEMGLEAMRLALSEPLASMPLSAEPPGNAGFLRPGSRLLVVIVSDEDDCSDPSAVAVTLEPACGAACTSDLECGDAGNYCVPEDLNNPGGPRRCQENRCETALGQRLLEPVESYIDFLRTLDDGTDTGRAREVYLAVIGAVDADGDPARCADGADAAQGVARRYRAAVDAMAERGYIDSICNADYGATLSQIAELVNAPQVIDLPGNPPSGALVVVEITRTDGTRITCTDGEGFSFVGAVYHHDGEVTAPARIIMEGDCRLLASDRLDIRYVCAS